MAQRGPKYGSTLVQTLACTASRMSAFATNRNVADVGVPTSLAA
jgi:hypothetical protein